MKIERGIWCFFLGWKPRWIVYGWFFLFSGAEEATLAAGRWEVDQWEDTGMVVISELSTLSHRVPVLLTQTLFL